MHLPFSIESEVTNKMGRHKISSMYNFGFFKTTMPETRKADYYIGCLDSSVFMDFNLSHDNRIYLKRISFDGYGCCELENPENKLEYKDSIKFIKEINKSKLDQTIMQDLVKKLIKMNKASIWIAALEEYKLRQ